MERHNISKRRRVHPVKPSTVERREFTRTYVNHLVPSLMMIKQGAADEKQDDGNLEKVVKQQVNMALALSATGFAWGSALKQKLQGNKTNGDHDEKQLMQLQVEGEGEGEEEINDDGDDEKIVSEKLEMLRSILPGGKEIESMHALLGELGCYIMCLESQVNVLRCLVHHQ